MKKIKLKEAKIRNFIKQAINEIAEENSVREEIAEALDNLLDLAIHIKGLAEQYNFKTLNDEIDQIAIIAKPQLDYFSSNPQLDEVTNRVLSIIKEDGEGGAIGGGATSCSPAGGDSVGQYTVPMGSPQRKSIYSPTLKRSKDFKNGSMSMQSVDDEGKDEVNKK